MMTAPWREKFVGMIGAWSPVLMILIAIQVPAKCVPILYARSVALMIPIVVRARGAWVIYALKPVRQIQIAIQERFV
jgi:hypothetical protein